MSALIVMLTNVEAHLKFIYFNVITATSLLQSVITNIFKKTSHTSVNINDSKVYFSLQ